MTSRLFLTGIEASGRHGAKPGEKDEPQDFVVDLDVEVQLTRDELAATADYRRITAAAREVVATESYDLLESLADAVAASVASVEGVVRVTAIVHKPAAASSLGIRGVAAGITVESEV